MGLTIISIHQGLPAFTGIGVAGFLLLSWIVWGYAWAVAMGTIDFIRYIREKKEALKKPAKIVTIKENFTDLAKEYSGSNIYILSQREEEYSSMFKQLSRQLSYPNNRKAHFKISTTFDFSNSNKIIHTIEATTPEAEQALTELKNKLLLSGKAEITFT